VLARAVAMREAEVREAQAAVDKAHTVCEERESELAEAESSIQDARQAIVEGKVELKHAEKAIKMETKAIVNFKAEKKNAVEDIKLVVARKRQLQDVEETVYGPLKEACVEGSERQRHMRLLCKAGEKHGLHKELLGVAPAILRKQLDKRQTFDRLVISSLDAEFTKHAEALSSKIQDGENILQTYESTLQAKQEALVRSRTQKKMSTRKISQAKANIGMGKKALAVARQRTKSQPSTMKRAARDLERAKARLEKLRSGPLAAYVRVLPLPQPDVKPSPDEGKTCKEEPRY